MTTEELAVILEQTGHYHYARVIRGITDEDRRAFEKWLENPDNRKRWDQALVDARYRLSQN